MYAIFETGGKQYKAEKGDIVFVEKLALDLGKLMTFDALVVADGDDVKIGTPIVEGAKVRAKVIAHGKEKKVVVFKYKPKRKYRKKQGHRQPYTKIQVTSISLAGSKDTVETESKTAAKTTTAKAAPKTAAKTTVKAAPKTAAKTTAKAAPKTAAKTTAKTTAKKPAAKNSGKVGSIDNNGKGSAQNRCEDRREEITRNDP